MDQIDSRSHRTPNPDIYSNTSSNKYASHFDPREEEKTPMSSSLADDDDHFAFNKKEEELNSECPVCLNLMVNPCKFPNKTCVHRFCIECLKSIFLLKIKETMASADGSQVRPPVCPLCQCESEIDQMDGLELDV